MADLDDLLDTSDVAELVGVKVPTIRTYLHRGDMPKPDRVIGRSPVWRRETIDAWLAERPGRGAGGGRPPKGDS